MATNNIVADEGDLPLRSDQPPEFPLQYFCPAIKEVALSPSAENVTALNPLLVPSLMVTRHNDMGAQNFSHSLVFEGNSFEMDQTLQIQSCTPLVQSTWRASEVALEREQDRVYQGLANPPPPVLSQQQSQKKTHIFQEQIPFETHDRSPVSELDEAAVSLPYRESPKLSSNSSSNGSPYWVTPTPGSQSDTSFPSDEGTDDLLCGGLAVEELSASHGGPCSREWNVPPRIRRNRKTKTLAVPPLPPRKKQQRRSDGSHRRGPFKEDWKRQNTALTRKLKCCIRCRMMRIRCEPDSQNLDGDCKTCQRAQSSKIAITCKLPCLRWKITDVSLYREQNMPCQIFSTRWKSMELIDITDWASNEIKIIELSQINVDAPYSVEVRKFVPVPGDMLDSVWNSKTGVRRHRGPVYAISDMQKVARTLVEFTQLYIPHYVLKMMGNADLLFWRTYYYAFQQQQKAKTKRERYLMNACFRFWVACRKISHSERIYSCETLGSEKVQDPDSPYYNVVPIPGIMKAQMECIMYTTILRPLKQYVLNELKELIMENKREHWLTIYLSLFLLLHNCSLLTRRDWETARQYSLQEYANQISIKEMHAGMQTMLAHFHYLNKGVLPFRLTYDEKDLRKLQMAADVDDEQLMFIQETARLIKDPRKVANMNLARQTASFGDDFYWVSQLYDDIWKPGPTVN